MNISVEITFTPLQTQFEEPIKQLIKNLRKSGLHVMENPLSTQVYGEYEQVMTVLNKEIKESLEGVEHGLVYLKVVKSDRSAYDPDF